MCFSASASFGAGVVLSIVGVASIKKAKSSSQLSFASIPVLFAVLQITEGFLWLSLTNPGFASLQQGTTYTFLFIAQVVWPVWVPYAIYRLEPRERRRKSMMILVGIGGLVSIYLAFCLLTFPVGAKVLGYHISYEQNYPAAIRRFSGLLYIIATIVPPFLSRIRFMWLLGTAILISYAITTIFYTNYIVSVWCFFASVISIAVYAILYQFNNHKKMISKPLLDEVSNPLMS